MQKRIVIFLHGLGGDPTNTWANLPDLISNDNDLKSFYCRFINEKYDTKFVGKTPSLTDIAELQLIDLISFAAQENIDEIAFIAHSQGGLLARQIISNWYSKTTKTTKHAPIFRLLSFATPHWGAYSEHALPMVKVAVSTVANVVEKLTSLPIPNSLLNLPSRQVTDLAYGAKSIEALNRNWAEQDLAEKVLFRYVAGAEDSVVALHSAIGANYGNDHFLIPNEGHLSLVKATDIKHPSFKITKDFLLQLTTVHPGITNPDRTPVQLQVFDSALMWTGRSARFIYQTRYTKLVDRDNELLSLNKFLNQPSSNNLSWWVISGPGGVGKSRLALEFSLAWISDWHAGFLNDSAASPDWGRWQPSLPTLIVIDYATGNVEKLNQILKGLSCRDSAQILRRPVRILLLNRNGQEGDLERAIGTGSSGEAIRSARHAECNLELSGVDCWTIISDYLARLEKNVPDKIKTLQKLKEIDPDSRPLFALLLADAIAEDPNLSFITKETIIKTVIEREREKFWLPAAGNDRNLLVKAEKVVAFATLVRGLNRDSAPIDLRWDVDAFYPIFSAITAYEKNIDRVAPLEPDLIGECFTADILLGFSKSLRQQYLQWAWDGAPIGIFMFFNRLAQDFPNQAFDLYPLTLELQNELSRRSWSGCAVVIVSFLDVSLDTKRAKGIAIFEALTSLRLKSDEYFPKLAWMQCGVTLGNAFCISGGTAISEAVRLCGQLKDFADHQPHEPEFRKLWASYTVNLIHALCQTGSGGVSKASVWLGLVKEMAIKTGENELDLAWARGAFDLIACFRIPSEESPSLAIALLSDLQVLSSIKPSRDLWLCWAKSAVNVLGFINTNGEHEQEENDYLTYFKSLLIKHDDAELRLAWAKVLINRIALFCSTVPARIENAQTVLLELRELANKYDELELKTKLAKGICFVVMYGYESSGEGMTKALRLLPDLRPTINQTADLELLQNWSKCVLRTVEAVCQTEFCLFMFADEVDIDVSQLGQMRMVGELRVPYAISLRFLVSAHSRAGNIELANAYSLCLRNLVKEFPLDKNIYDFVQSMSR